MKRIAVIAPTYVQLMVALMNADHRMDIPNFSRSPMRIGGMWRAEILV